MTRAKGSPIHPSARHLLSKEVDLDGEAVVAKRVGVSATTLARAIAGLGVYPATALAVRVYLDQRPRTAA